MSETCVWLISTAPIAGHAVLRKVSEQQAGSGSGVASFWILARYEIHRDLVVPLRRPSKLTHVVHSRS